MGFFYVWLELVADGWAGWAGWVGTHSWEQAGDGGGFTSWPGGATAGWAGSLGDAKATERLLPLLPPRSLLTAWTEITQNKTTTVRYTTL